MVGSHHLVMLLLVVDTLNTSEMLLTQGVRCSTSNHATCSCSTHVCTQAVVVVRAVVHHAHPAHARRHACHR